MSEANRSSTTTSVMFRYLTHRSCTDLYLISALPNAASAYKHDIILNNQRPLKVIYLLRRLLCVCCHVQLILPRVECLFCLLMLGRSHPFEHGCPTAYRYGCLNRWYPLQDRCCHLLCGGCLLLHGSWSRLSHGSHLLAVLLHAGKGRAASCNKMA